MFFLEFRNKSGCFYLLIKNAGEYVEEEKIYEQRRNNRHIGKNFQNEISYGVGQVFRIDEPESVGGDGTGPNPYTLLLGALGGCTSMTVMMYARRKAWKLERVRVYLRQERIHAEDCADCPANGSAFIHQISRRIEFEGDLTDEQTDRLREIGTKCPVGKTLEAGIRIVEA